jgi:hypothetical protein
LGLVPEIKDGLESAAESLSNEWLKEYSTAIKGFSDERQDVYRQIREMSAEPLDVDLVRPYTWLQPTKAIEESGKEVALPTFAKHLLCDEEGLFPVVINAWEEKVLVAEMQREAAIAWYRNPGRASQDSLGVVYEYGGEKSIVRPDFIFFSQSDDGSIVADIVDPHGHHLAEALPKLKGLANYYEANAGKFRRFESVAETDGSYRVLDLTDENVRKAIESADSAVELYKHQIARDYHST